MDYGVHGMRQLRLNSRDMALTVSTYVYLVCLSLKINIYIHRYRKCVYCCNRVGRAIVRNGARRPICQLVDLMKSNLLALSAYTSFRFLTCLILVWVLFTVCTCPAQIVILPVVQQCTYVIQNICDPRFILIYQYIYFGYHFWKAYQILSEILHKSQLFFTRCTFCCIRSRYDTCRFEFKEGQMTESVRYPMPVALYSYRNCSVHTPW